MNSIPTTTRLKPKLKEGQPFRKDDLLVSYRSGLTSRIIKTVGRRGAPNRELVLRTLATGEVHRTSETSAIAHYRRV